VLNSIDNPKANINSNRTAIENKTRPPKIRVIKVPGSVGHVAPGIWVIKTMIRSVTKEIEKLMAEDNNFDIG
jgi:hypothetical protein